jgi:hypothetical protein
VPAVMEAMREGTMMIGVEFISRYQFRDGHPFLVNGVQHRAR